MSYCMIIFINNKVKIAVNNQRIKNKFHSIGIYPMGWVQGPKGEKWDKGDSSTANIDFTNVTLIIKKYNVAI